MDSTNDDSENAIRLMLGRLDKFSFTKFCFELFAQSDFNKNYELQKTYYIEKFGENIIEQNYIGRKEQHCQGYDLIIPFLEPLDLFKSINQLDVGTCELEILFKYYQKLANKRYARWNFGTDGNYIMPNIKFITNYSGFGNRIYEDILIPKFEKFVEKFDFDSQIWVGSLDTFFKKNPIGTCKAFNRFIGKYQNEISINFNDSQKFKVQGNLCEKYFDKGVLKKSLSPCEPIISYNIYDKFQIINEFEFLINKNSKENELESFLKKYFKYVFGPDFDRIETQLWLKFPELDINNKNRRLDVFLRNAVSRDWELFELKRANNIVKKYKDIPTFTAELNSALQQIRNYKRILSQDIVKRALANDGIDYCVPELRLVIGKTPDIPLEHWRHLKTTNEHDLKIMTWDELSLGLKSRLEFHSTHNLFNIQD